MKSVSNPNVRSRLVIYPKDVQLITGRGKSSATRLISRMRKLLGKSKDQVITIQEFCAYMGLDEHSVYQLLRSVTWFGVSVNFLNN